jgi:vanillate O-demethylase ferredoxin subunit
MYDCKRGECGLCALNVLESSGSIDHRDVFFSERERAENHKICACVSRAVGGVLTVDTAYRGKAAA